MGRGKSTGGGVGGCPGCVELGDDGQGVGAESRRRFVTRGGGGGGGNQIWCTVDTSWDTSWWTPAGAQ